VVMQGGSRWVGYLVYLHSDGCTVSVPVGVGKRMVEEDPERYVQEISVLKAC